MEPGTKHFGKNGRRVAQSKIAHRNHEIADLQSRISTLQAANGVDAKLISDLVADIAEPPDEKEAIPEA